ncbi:MAG: hypothetical protein L0221_04390 [Chloroflexi bacterium]|nr:hypothetical protein [Chloroflexota bacterium]
MTRAADQERELRDLRDLADGLGRSWRDVAERQTTAGRERAVLRLFGVDGLDRDGRPLAAEVVDRYLSADRSRLPAGIALPFAVALLEYDVPPQRLALDVASGAVDLGLEAKLLQRRDKATAAQAEAERLVTAAVDRIDANRTARHELLELLGDAPRPWVGTHLVEPAVHEAADEARQLVRDGADVVQVDVPAGRELVRRLGERGVEVPRWLPRERGIAPPSDDAPAGSQRGLAGLRDSLDRAAASRGAYVRLLATPPALATPETAVVAAFERIDIVEGDPVTEIVSSGVDPARAIADHVAAAAFHRRAGTAVLLGAGPLTVAPDLAAGMPSDPATRAGRSIALQLVAAALMRAVGLPPDAIHAGALPAWLADEPDAVPRSAADVALRKALLPEHPLAFVEPAEAERGLTWPYLVSALVPRTSAGGLVLRRRSAGSFASVAASTRAAVAVAQGLDRALAGRELSGPAAEHWSGALAAIRETLERLQGDGWDWLAGPPREAARGGLGRDSVATRKAGTDVVGRAFGPGRLTAPVPGRRARAR